MSSKIATAAADICWPSTGKKGKRLGCPARLCTTGPHLREEIKRWRGQKVLTLGVVYPFSSHRHLLRKWHQLPTASIRNGTCAWWWCRLRKWRRMVKDSSRPGVGNRLAKRTNSTAWSVPRRHLSSVSVVSCHIRKSKTQFPSFGTLNPTSGLDHCKWVQGVGRVGAEKGENPFPTSFETGDSRVIAYGLEASRFGVFSSNEQNGQNST